MLGILILIFVGRAFYKLAQNYKRKNAWIYPVIGIASYYGGMISGVFIIGFIMSFSGDVDEAIAMIGAIPIGIGICWGLYAILKYNWKNEQKTDVEILDDNL